MALNMMLQPRLLLLSLVLVLLCLLVPSCHSQISTSPQNIETFYPNETSTPTPAPAPAPPKRRPEPPTKPQPSPAPPKQRPEPPTKPQPSPPPTHEPAKGPVAASSGTSSNGKVATAVAATAASTIVVCGLLFFICQRCLRARRRKEKTNNPFAGDSRVMPQGNAFERIDGNVKGLIVDEDGLDVVYWRKLEGRNSKRGLHKEVLHSPKDKGREKEKEEDGHEGNQVKKSKAIQEVPLLRGKSSTSHINIVPEVDEPYRMERIPLHTSAPNPIPTSFPASVGAAFNNVQKPDSPTQSSTPPPPASPSTPSSDSLSAIPKGNNSPAVPAPPPLPIPARKSPAPPPPPPPKAGSLRSSSKQRSAPLEMLMTSTSKRTNSSRTGTAESDDDQVKLKPLHWDKVNTNADHSMVWDKVDHGSFRVDQDLMEALFGYIATNRRSPKGKNPSKDTSASSAKIFLLDPKKSQNTAIVLKSLAVSQDEILDALIDGKGLNADTLEKLVRIAPTEEEQSLILEYTGDPARLAAAESYLCHILKAVPSAFKRLSAMLFRLNYDSEILEIKESLQVLELGCKELKNQKIFVKLLEAVLKAGNRMNAGTARGNAQAFNLASLRKLSDVKSTNGKTTLLHFVVEEVVRSEGKRVLLNRNGSLSRNSSRSSNNSNENFENYAASNEQRERECTTLGLPVVGGISSEFFNVKKAALIDYNTLIGSISTLSTQILEIQEIVSQCRRGEGEYFVKEMEHFIRDAGEELRSVKEEQTRVMQLIKRTTEYYQGGPTRDTAENSLQLFVIVKDFMGMVDQVCIDIARNMQKGKTHKTSSYG